MGNSDPDPDYPYNRRRGALARRNCVNARKSQAPLTLKPEPLTVKPETPILATGAEELSPGGTATTPVVDLHSAT